MLSCVAPFLNNIYIIFSRAIFTNYALSRSRHVCFHEMEGRKKIRNYVKVTGFDLKMFGALGCEVFSVCWVAQRNCLHSI